MGLGNTSADIADDLVGVASQVYLSHSRGAHVVCITKSCNEILLTHICAASERFEWRACHERPNPSPHPAAGHDRLAVSTTTRLYQQQCSTQNNQDCLWRVRPFLETTRCSAGDGYQPHHQRQAHPQPALRQGNLHRRHPARHGPGHN